MNKDQARELHWLLLSFAGLFHKKFLLNLRKQSSIDPRAKKNQVKIMNVLYQQEGLTPTELGKMLDIEKGSLTTLLDQLEEMGFIVREIDPDDRRKLLLSLSVVGREKMDVAMDHYTGSIIELFANVDREELETFKNSLRVVVDFMKKL